MVRKSSASPSVTVGSQTTVTPSSDSAARCPLPAGLFCTYLGSGSPKNSRKACCRQSCGSQSRPPPRLRRTGPWSLVVFEHHPAKKPTEEHASRRLPTKPPKRTSGTILQESPKRSWSTDGKRQSTYSCCWNVSMGCRGFHQLRGSSFQSFTRKVLDWHSNDGPREPLLGKKLDTS